jgi:hypothetical protein
LRKLTPCCTRRPWRWGIEAIDAASRSSARTTITLGLGVGVGLGVAVGSGVGAIGLPAQATTSRTSKTEDRSVQAHRPVQGRESDRG